MTEQTTAPSASVTVEEACRQIGVGKVKLYELMAAGELAYISLPPHTQRAGRRIEQAEIDAFKTRHRIGAATP